MQPYHQAWLDAHPERDEAWLRRQLADGFDVHHMDGDHSNNDPGNLVLIEAADHMRLHSGGRGCLRSLRPPQNGGRRPSDGANEEMAYLLRCSGMTWREIGHNMGTTKTTALQRAKKHALASGESWPVSV